MVEEKKKKGFIIGSIGRQEIDLRRELNQAIRNNDENLVRMCQDKLDEFKEIQARITKKQTSAVSNHAAIINARAKDVNAGTKQPRTKIF